MKKLLFLLPTLSILIACENQKNPKTIITSDITNFWIAYDKITSTKDSTLQYKYLDSLYLKKGTDGLRAMRHARNYTSQEYILAINKYPKFWNSIREHTLKADLYSSELEQGIENLKKIYNDIKPAKIYFTIGALRSNGTTLDSLVLIGSELALADSNTPTNEFPNRLSHLRPYFDSDPSNNIVFLNIHEYIHTQQTTTTGYNLLAQTVIEGVAEFLTEKALGVNSPNPQIEFGQKHDAEIKKKFTLEMFSPYLYNWIWNSADNEFNMRDLAYYVGYAICENYYNNARDKEKAIKEMIQLNYNNETDLINFVEKSGYFEQPLKTYKDIFEKSRPTVVALKPFENNDQNVAPETNEITVVFSETMNKRFRNFNYGPLGEDALMRIKNVVGWSDDGKSLTLKIEDLNPNSHYQITIGSGFRNLKNIPLKEYLIDFKTKSQQNQ
jgi:hypothetical protein